MGIVIQGFSDEPYKLVLKLIGTNAEKDEDEAPLRERKEQVNLRKNGLKYRQV